jgi:aspartyl-tRNA(Asn)/glutamyl-tRNA(Gln) amidotransferase subunit A
MASDLTQNRKSLEGLTFARSPRVVKRWQACYLWSMDEFRPSRRQVLAAGAAAPLIAALNRRATAAEAAAPTDPADLTLVEVLPRLERRELSARELIDACIARVERLEPVVKAFVTTTFELARTGAAAADEARAAGRPAGVLAGVPVGLKDVYYTKGIRTTASSKVLADFIPGSDATVWARLAGAGAVLAGKLNTHEFALGTSSPPTTNPWDTRRNPGGSSGGSAAALAARMLPVALGTDTAASIRLPAAVCGVAGLKPTYGRCSRHGVIPLAWSLDCTGPMARRLADVAVLLGLMAGADPADPTSLSDPVGPYPAAAPEDLRGVRVGIPDRYFWDGVDAGIARVCRDGLARLEALGAELVDFAMPPSTDAVVGERVGPLERTLIVEGVTYHRRLIRERAALYSPEVLATFEAGEGVSGPDYVDAQRLRATWTREWRAAFADHRLDVVASPVVPAPPGPQTPSQAFAAGPSFDLTKPWNLNGFPALSVPVGLDERGLPVGLQLAALPLAEARLLGIGMALDEDVAFFRRRPPIVEALP